MDTGDSSRFFFLPVGQKLTYLDTLDLLQRMNQFQTSGEKWRMLEIEELQQIARGPTEQKAMFTGGMYWCKVPEGSEKSGAVIMATGVYGTFIKTSQIQMRVVFVKA